MKAYLGPDYYSHQMTIAARAIATMKVLRLRSKRVAMRRQSLKRQPVRVKVTAYPDRVFKGKITTIGTTVDPNTHRTFIRTEILDPEHLLLSGMYASFVIETGEPVRATAVPYAAVVREGDGTMTVFVTTDGLKFVKRIVEIGLRRDGYAQILKGLKPGERIATQGALLLGGLLIRPTFGAWGCCACRIAALSCLLVRLE
jgi:multidrug efflux pump subunit AcrA (membrane-fusion protein)